MDYGLSDNTWGEEEKEAVISVLESGRYTMGAKVKEFEAAFCKKFGSKFAVFVNSGSSANLLAIAALFYSGKLKRGDEVIVPAISWSTTYAPLMQYGLKLVFVDVDKETLNIDVSQIAGAVTEKTKAVFAVNLLGNPVDYDSLKKVCNEKNLFIIEDNCESLGAVYGGIPAGRFGIIGTYSSFFSHHICTMEGGVAVTDDEELYHYMLSIRAHGWTRDIPEGSPLYKKSEDEFYEMFNFILPGYNLRPLEMEAAIGLIQLKKMDTFIANRRGNAKYLTGKIKKTDKFYTQKETGESSWFGFPIILKDNSKEERNKIVSDLRAKSIEVRPIVGGNFVKNKVINFAEYRVFSDLANAEHIHNNGFFVGNHSERIDDRINFLFDILKNNN